MKTTRVASGLYRIVMGGMHFKVEEVSKSEGFPKAQWNISVIGSDSSIYSSYPAAFDAADTLKGAKDLIRIFASASAEEVAQ